MLFNKKGISPVVAVSLLLVVSVISVVGFQNWFTNFSSQTISQIEIDTQNTNSQTKINGLINNQLYINKNTNSKINEIKVFSKGEEICSIKKQNISNSIYNQGLVGHWKFNDLNSTIKDYSGNSLDGKLFGYTKMLIDFQNNNGTHILDSTNYNLNVEFFGGQVSSDNCLNGICLKLDGTPGDYVQFTNSNPNYLNKETDFSVNLWFNWAFNQTGKKMLITNRYDGGTGYYIGLDGEYLEVRIGLENGTSSYDLGNSQIINQSQWYMLTLVANSNTSSVYLNGNLVEDYTGYLNLSSKYNVTRIGKYLGGSQIYLFNGSIDELSIYSKPITQSEITQLYNSQKAQFLEFKTNGLELDGVDNYVIVQDNPALNITQDLGIIYKFTRYSGNPHSTLISKHYNGPYDLTIWGDKLHYYNGPNYQNSNEVIYEKIFPYNKELSLITSRNFSSKYVYTYLNGEFLNKTLFGTDLQFNDNPPAYSVDLTFGTRIIGTQRYFNGIVSEVLLYNRTISTDEIENDLLSNLENSKTSEKIDLSKCNLNKNNAYDILITDDNGLIETSLINQ